MVSNVPQLGSNVSALQQQLRREHISATDSQRIITDASNIFRHCLVHGMQGVANGLIYGHIQSGKTAVIIATIAIALDNGYRSFVVLTSDLNDLYAQTLDRIRSSIQGAQVLEKKQFKQTLAVSPPVSPQVPIILVASKNSTILRRLSQVIVHLGRQTDSFIIVDDEADQASLNTNINQPAKPPSGVNREIITLTRSLNSYNFLQTTATPQALLLQDTQSIFKPSFVVVTTPGTGYIGGDHFFDPTNPDHIRIVAALDVVNLRNSSVLPGSVAQSIFAFFVGAAILRLLQGDAKNYTYLLHTSLKRDDHEYAAQLVSQFIAGFTAALTGSAPQTSLPQHIKAGLSDAYADMKNTFKTLPPLADVIAEVQRCVTSTEVLEINTRTGAGVKPTQSSRHTFYIGGAKIGRGVTVKNLLVTYYGRDAASPQVDTVLQHARMYGYRKNELPATRIYLPQTLATRFGDIHESDNAIRGLCQATGAAIPVIPLPSGLRPTRANVLNETNVSVRAYLGGRQYFPLVPESRPLELGNQTVQLDMMLSQYSKEQNPYSITIDEMLRVLSFKFKEPNTSGAWDDVLIRRSFETIQQKFNNSAQLVIVNRSSKLRKSGSRGHQVLGSVLPGSQSQGVPYGVSSRYPALFMTRLDGKIDPTGGGWNGVPFWVPVVRFPDGNYAIAVNYS